MGCRVRIAVAAANPLRTSPVWSTPRGPTIGKPMTLRRPSVDTIWDGRRWRGPPATL